MALALMQRGFTVPFAPRPVASGCTAPTTTNRWLPSTSCSSGSACLNDAVASNNAVQATHYPSYSATGGPNSTADLSFNGSSNYLQFPTAIAQGSSETVTLYAIVEPETTSRSALIAGGAAQDIGWADSNSTAHQWLANVNTASIGSGTATLTAGSWYAIAITIQATASGTGNYAFYKESGGSYSSDGSATGVTAFPTSGSTSNQIGLYYTGTYAQFNLAELGYYNGVWNGTQLTAWATYAHCQYGL